MATNTYVALGTTTLSTSAASITVSGIPQGYTDLEIKVHAKTGPTAGNSSSYLLTFNGDTGNNYGTTFLYGINTSVGSGRYSSRAQTYVGRVSSNAFSTSKIVINNYSNPNIYKTILSQGYDPYGYVIAFANSWFKSTKEAITSFTLTDEALQNFDAGSTVTVYGIAANSETFSPKATGGTITSDISYFYHTFTASGTFTPSVAMDAEVLVVAGGGAGGRFGGGGGGAGGLRNATLSLSQGTAYTATVGGQATNSTFSTITSTGGGGGYDYQQSNGTGYGPYNGGSGGGARYGGGSFGTGNAGGFTPPEGYDGGGSFAGGNANYGCGGGGGAGQAGAAGANSTNSGGKGGDGVNTYSAWATITGTGVNGYYAGGGGGSTLYNNPGGGGAGGGGAGAGQNGQGGSGSPNTGSGGGGSGSGNYAYGQGGSGIIIVRYAK